MKGTLGFLLFFGCIVQDVFSWELPSADEPSGSSRRAVMDCAVEDEVTYTGAVLEYEPFKDWNIAGGPGILRENVLRIIEFADAAKSLGADIFVAPEYGLQSLEMMKNETSKMITVTQVVPDPATRTVPCDDTTDPPYSEAVHDLSCAARQLEMYLVIDMAEQVACDQANTTCPEYGLYFYNTQAVFDRDGAVIARYRKQNLYLEPQFQPGPPVDAEALFDTDFGVRFSLQVCFDITYEHPAYSNVLHAGVRDVVMSTAWVDEVPFLPAINVQNGWSRSMAVNLLVSGYHWPEHTKLGSGIYLGQSDRTFAYSFDPDSGDVLVVSPVHTCRTGPVERETEQLIREAQSVQFQRSRPMKSEREHAMLHEDLSVYNMTVLPPTNSGETNSVTLCHDDDLCCSIEYEHSRSDLTYQLLTTSGIIKKGAGTYRIYVQICGIVWCTGEDWQSCALVDETLPEEDEFGPFALEANFQCDIVFPVAITRNLTLISNDVYLDTISAGAVGTTHTMVVENGMGSMMSTALFGRWFARDT